MLLPFLNVDGKIRKWGSLAAASLFFAFSFLLVGCDLLAPKGDAPLASTPAIQHSSAEPSGQLMTKGERYSFYRWLVKEMQEQIFARPLKSNGQVDIWANVLSQQGSLEGVYHGFVLSTDYTSQETGKANLPALKFFAKEMAELQFSDLPTSDPKVVQASEGYVTSYMDKPLFTLKRALGERILDESIKRKGDPEGLAAWYAPFAARWSAMGVPLGNEQRSRTDEAFHFKWAKENNLGLVQWELLNRAHRILNSLGGIAISANVPANLPGK